MTTPITVVMTVYFPEGEVGKARLESAKQTLFSWVKYLRYPNLRLHIADDSPVNNDLARQKTVQELGDMFRAAVRNKSEWPDALTYSHQLHQGVGTSMNVGFAKGFETSPLVLYAVDDWALTMPLDLEPWACLLERDESIGCVRLGPPHPDLTGTVKHIPEGWMLILERHHFSFATRPALYHSRFTSVYGKFQENVDAYQVEWDYLQRYRDQVHGPAVVYALPVPWEHVGTVEVSRVQPGVVAVA